VPHHVDLDAIAHNVGLIAAMVAPSRVVAVVKADGYGHGAVAVAQAALGGEGLRDLARQNHARAAYARERLAAVKGVSMPHAAPFFNEFVVRLPGAAARAVETLAGRGLAAGIPLSRYVADRDRDLLVAVTEMNPKAAIDRLADEIGRLA